MSDMLVCELLPVLPLLLDELLAEASFVEPVCCPRIDSNANLITSGFTSPRKGAISTTSSLGWLL
jgi:hypothetical protein